MATILVLPRIARARARQPPEGAEPSPHPQLPTSHSDATRWGPTGPGTASLSLGNARPSIPGPLPTSFLLHFCVLARVEAAGAGRLACPDSPSSGLCARAWPLALWLLPGGGRAAILYPRSKACSHASGAPCALRHLLPREECAWAGRRPARPANPRVPQQNGSSAPRHAAHGHVSGILPSDPQLWLTPAPSTAASSSASESSCF